MELYGKRILCIEVPRLERSQLDGIDLLIGDIFLPDIDQECAFTEFIRGS